MNRNPIARLLNLAELVAGQEHGATLGAEGAQQLTDLTDTGRIESVGGLVEDEQRGSYRTAPSKPRRCRIPSENLPTFSSAWSSKPTRLRLT